ncbi:MAG: hypothetical protein SGARI_003542, partial [Bacillariaceae sp.]
MGFGDRETVSVIGGGHAYGKAHGACPSDEADAEGFCNGGTSWTDKLTSGLEVTWTEAPTTWTNLYFQHLVNLNFTETESPAGALQWEPTDPNAPDIDMMTSDLALYLGDPAYKELVLQYASDLDAITTDFGASWYQLMARDMGPRSRCLGDELPADLQPWELDYNFPTMDMGSLPDFILVRSSIQGIIDEDSSNIQLFSDLAKECASTFRATDQRGGCNGAAVRFAPQSEWEQSTSANTATALSNLETVKTAFPDVTYADLIVLAGITAVEAAGGNPVAFCPGRSDAEDGAKSEGLEYTVWNNKTYDSIVYNIENTGMSLAEGVALQASPVDGVLTHEYFVNLQASDPENDLFQAELGDVVNQFIADNDYFLASYADGFNYMITADMFDGPTGNACEGVD